MNWQRGGLRLWLVASAAWLIFVAWNVNLPLALSAFWNKYPSQQVLDEERTTGVQFVIGKNGKWEKCVPPKVVKTAEDFLACIFSPLDDTPPITRDAAEASLQKFAIEGFVPPLAGAALSLALLWAARGFRKHTK